MEGSSPFRNQPWGNTQKNTLNAHHDRWLLGGIIIGEDDELVIKRHPLTAFSTPFQTGVTLASQTGLHIIISDTRDVVGLKLTNDGVGSGDAIQQIGGADGATELGTLDSAGQFNSASMAAIKQNMIDISDEMIEDIIKKLPVYIYQFKALPTVNAVGPESAEFHKTTGLGDGKRINPLTLAGVAMRAVQRLWKRFAYTDKRLTEQLNRIKALEAQAGITPPEDDGETTTV